MMVLVANSHRPRRRWRSGIDTYHMIGWQLGRIEVSYEATTMKRAKGKAQHMITIMVRLHGS